MFHSLGSETKQTWPESFWLPALRGGLITDIVVAVATRGDLPLWPERLGEGL